MKNTNSGLRRKREKRGNGLVNIIRDPTVFMIFYFYTVFICLKYFRRKEIKGKENISFLKSKQNSIPTSSLQLTGCGTLTRLFDFSELQLPQQ